ncbi:Uma2 family endonuclease [Micromonospora sp. NPDC085948]
MTTELETFRTPEGGWTTDDLDRIPDDNRRRELLDGILLVPPPPRTTHQQVTARLMAALDDMAPDGYDGVHGVEVRLSDRRTFVPDGVILHAADDEDHRHWYAPRDVVLAVEVVGEGTETLDRLVKPALYAQAGIPFYWRIETQRGALEVVTYRIDASNEAYTETGRWTTVVDTGEPFPINLPISRITPRVR